MTVCAIEATSPRFDDMNGVAHRRKQCTNQQVEQLPEGSMQIACQEAVGLT